MTIIEALSLRLQLTEDSCLQYEVEGDFEREVAIHEEHVPLSSTNIRLTYQGIIAAREHFTDLGHVHLNRSFRILLFHGHK